MSGGRSGGRSASGIPDLAQAQARAASDHTRANADHQQVVDNLAGIAQAQAEQGLTAVPDEAALAGKSAGGYRVLATNERVYWDGAVITARAPLAATQVEVQEARTLAQEADTKADSASNLAGDVQARVDAAPLGVATAPTTRLIGGIPYVALPTFATLTPNGVSIVAEGGRTYIRQGSALTPFEFGAVPSPENAAVDCGSALRAWAEAVSASGTPGLLPELRGGLAWRSSMGLQFTGDAINVDMPGLIVMLPGAVGSDNGTPVYQYAVDFFSGPNRTNTQYGGYWKNDESGTPQLWNYWQNSIRVGQVNVRCDYNSLGVALRRWDHSRIERVRVWSARGHGLLLDGMREMVLDTFILQRCLGIDGRPVFDVADIAGGDANNSFKVMNGHILTFSGRAMRVASPYKTAPESGAGQNPARFLEIHVHVEGGREAELFDVMRDNHNNAAVFLQDVKGLKLTGLFACGDQNGETECVIQIGDDANVPTDISIDADVFGHGGNGALIRVVNGANIDLEKVRTPYLGGRLRRTWWHARVPRSVNGQRPATRRVLSDSMLVQYGERSFASLIDSMTGTYTVPDGIPGQLPKEVAARYGTFTTVFNALAGSLSRTAGRQALQIGSGADLLWGAEARSMSGTLGGVPGTLYRVGNPSNRGGNQDSAGINGLYEFEALYPRTADTDRVPNPLTWVPAQTEWSDVLYLCAGRNTPLEPDQTLTYLRSITDALGTRGRYLVIGVPLADSERASPADNAQRVAVERLNMLLREQYGVRFVDWEAIHAAGGYGTPDGLHPQEESVFALVQVTVARLRQLGW